MMSQPTANEESGRKHLDVPAVPKASKSEEEYKVGPGRPPRQHQFKPGQSGNPKGAKRKPPPIALDLKQALERALNKTVTLKQGDREREVTAGVAGMEQLVAQFAKGDPRARRDLFILAPTLGIDLMPDAQRAVTDALAPDHKAILDAHVLRQIATMNPSASSASPVLAPPDLLDDDVESSP
jgi:hypothetical protein